MGEIKDCYYGTPFYIGQHLVSGDKICVEIIGKPFGFLFKKIPVKIYSWHCEQDSIIFVSYRTLKNWYKICLKDTL